MSRVFPRLSIAMTHTYAQNQALSDGVITSATYKYLHKAGAREVDGPRLVFANTSGNSGGEVSPTNDILVKAGLLVGSTRYPAFFGGRRVVTIEPRGLVISDPIGVSLAAGASAFSLTRPAVQNAGEKWPLGQATLAARNEGKTDSADLVDSGSVTTGFAFGYGPVAILGKHQSGYKDMLVIGDSIAANQGPSWNGYVLQVLDELAVPHSNLAIPGLIAQQFLNYQTRVALSSLCGCATAYIADGTNDIAAGSSAAAVIAALNAQAAFVRRCGAQRVIMATILPRTNPSNVAVTGFGPGSVAETVNAAIRGGGVAGVNVVADLYAAVASGPDSFTWSSAPADGVHPDVANTNLLIPAFRSAVQTALAA